MEVKLLKMEKFSNRNFNIEIFLYEQGLAKGYMRCKRKGIARKRSRYSNYLFYLLGYNPVCAAEYDQFLDNFINDKIAHRWVRRVMRPYLEEYLRADGRLDFNKFHEERDRCNYISREYFELTKEQLLIAKKFVPELFECAGFRTLPNRFNRNFPKVLKEPEPNTKKLHPILQRKIRQGKLDYDRRYYVENCKMLQLIKELMPAFYEEVCRKRNLSNCRVEIEYCFNSGENPKMWFKVQDKGKETVCYELPPEED